MSKLCIFSAMTQKKGNTLGIYYWQINRFCYFIQKRKGIGPDMLMKKKKNIIKTLRHITKERKKKERENRRRSIWKLKRLLRNSKFKRNFKESLKLVVVIISNHYLETMRWMILSRKIYEVNNFKSIYLNLIVLVVILGTIYFM